MPEKNNLKSLHGFELFPGEEMVFVMRKHWIVDLICFLKWFFWGIGVVAMVSGGAYYLGLHWGTPTAYILGAILCMYLTIITLSSFIGWLNEELDVIVVTNDRVIDITQVGLFHRNIIETRLEHVQDAMGSVKGFFNTLFNWGEIHIRTANDVGEFFIDMIPDPHDMARKIFSLANEAKKREHKMLQKLGQPKTPEDRQEKFHQEIEDILENPQKKEEEIF